MRAAREPVVLVHGLWMNGAEFSVLRHRLQARHDFDAHVFPYPSLHGDAAEIAAELAEFARRCAAGAERVHVVGHSLGGAIAYRALEQGLRDVPGHTVVMASPLNGCRAAHGAVQFSMLRSLLGPHVLNELAARCDRGWTRDAPRTLGAIAGSRRLGIGQFFAHFDEDNDGTVAVTETLIPGLTDHLVLPHSHIGMLFASDVADQVAHFLRHGRFDRAGVGEPKLPADTNLSARVKRGFAWIQTGFFLPRLAWLFTDFHRCGEPPRGQHCAAYDNGKPVERRGRKATGLTACEGPRQRGCRDARASRDSLRRRAWRSAVPGNPSLVPVPRLRTGSSIDLGFRRHT